MIRILAGALALAALYAPPAWAIRPFDGELAEVVELHAIELELGPLEPVVAGAARSLVLPQVQLDYGLLPEWAVVVRSRDTVAMGGEEAGNYRLEGAMAGVKGLVRSGSLQGEAGPSVAVEAGALLPTWGANMPGTLGGSFAGIISHRWGPVVVGADAEVFYSRSGHPGGFFSAIVEGPGWMGLRPVLELAGEDIVGEAPTYSALMGGTATLGRDLSVDAGVRAGFGGPEADLELRMGLTWLFMISSAR
ncbi:MAG: hypothetical protein JWM80_6727 [Cyanobacteria bacterium RYN_339]|nr:hypothetical protein [Cyanobacteria bacterium RYN_339]